MNPKRFENKVAIVTGACRGIGQAIALAFAREGAHVVSICASEPADITARMSSIGATFTALTEDLGKLTQKGAADLVARIVMKTGRVDILVNNAGIIKRAPIVDHSEADWNAVIQINLSAPFFLSQAVAKWWLAGGRENSPAGARLKVVNIASMLSFQGGIFVPGYTASKSGIAGITKAFANELAKERMNFNAVAPDTSPRTIPKHCAKTPFAVGPFSTAFPKPAGVRPKTLRAPSCSWPRPRRII